MTYISCDFIASRGYYKKKKIIIVRTVVQESTIALIKY